MKWSANAISWSLGTIAALFLTLPVAVYAACESCQYMDKTGDKVVQGDYWI
jgi:hypothetical protein